MSTCGQCRHARMMPGNDLNLRACFGLPPEVVATPRAGGMAIQTVERPVAAARPACSLFQLRTAVELPSQTELQFESAAQNGGAKL